MIRDEIASLLRSAAQQAGVDGEVQLAHPADPTHGDYSTSIALKYAKELNVSPIELAQKIVDAVQQSELIDRVEVVKPGFINVHLSPLQLINQLESFTQDNFFASTFFPKNHKTVIVEYSSPNIAKPFTIGHLRSTIIGDAIANILETTGYSVKRDNHVGDWGTQFGKLIVAIERWGNIENLSSSPRPIKLLVDLYVKFHTEAERDPALEDLAREKFALLERGDPKVKQLWQQCVDWSWKEFNEIYSKLGIRFTENDGRGFGESFFESKLNHVITHMREKGILTESEGAQIVAFPNDKYPPLMIVKKDGASLYATRDLATDLFRLENEGKSVRIINEVGAEQSLYFQQLYEIERMLGWFDPIQRYHLKHGLYRFKDQKMSTRKGNTIWLEDVIDEAVARAKKLGNDDATSQTVAIASLKWNDLKHSPQQDVIFDWDQILNMEGNSGPYMLYTYVRAKSILDKAGEWDPKNRGVALESTEATLLRHLHQYPEVVEQAAQQYLPSTVATYLYQLAQMYNLFYQSSPILKAEGELRSLRLSLTSATANILRSGLGLLGIQTVEKM